MCVHCLTCFKFGKQGDLREEKLSIFREREILKSACRLPCNLNRRMTSAFHSKKIGLFTFHRYRISTWKFTLTSLLLLCKELRSDCFGFNLRLIKFQCQKAVAKRPTEPSSTQQVLTHPLCVLMADVKPKGCIIKDPLVFFLLERNINDDVIVRSIRLERGEWHQFVEEQQALYKVSKMSKLSLELLSILLFIGVQSVMITCANLLSFSLSLVYKHEHIQEKISKLEWKGYKMVEMRFYLTTEQLRKRYMSLKGTLWFRGETNRSTTLNLGRIQFRFDDLWNAQMCASPAIVCRLETNGSQFNWHSFCSRLQRDRN